MSSSESNSPQDEDNFHHICYLMGLGLVTFKKIEDAHFKIYCRLLDVPMHEMASVAYHNIESFHARRRMVGGMATYFLQPDYLKNHRAKWQDLDKLLKDANDNRNKLAHYAVDYDLIGVTNEPDGSVTVKFTKHRLRPAEADFAARLLGRTKDKEEHNLGPTQLKRIIAEFRELAARLEEFHVSISHDELAKAQGALPSPVKQLPHRQSGGAPPKEDEPPSGQ